MTPAPRCVTQDERLDAVAAAMQVGHFRQMPVVDADGRLIGIVTQRDLREHKGYLDSTKVSAALTEPALAVGPEDSIDHAARIVLERKIGGLPVIDAQSRVVGILTTSDLLRGLLHDSGGADSAVRIDCTARSRTLTEAVQVIEAAGAAVLGLGSNGAASENPRRFFVRVAAEAAERAAGALQAAGFAPRAAVTRP